MTETKDIQTAANVHYISRFSYIKDLLAGADNPDAPNDEREDFETQLQEMPLSVELEAVYPPREICTWSILIGTGGPADRVLVTTDFDGEVESAIYQFQDWFTPWTDAQDQDSELVERFARVFYFGTVHETLANKFQA